MNNQQAEIYAYGTSESFYKCLQQIKKTDQSIPEIRHWVSNMAAHLFKTKYSNEFRHNFLVEPLWLQVNDGWQAVHSFQDYFTLHKTQGTHVDGFMMGKWDDDNVMKEPDDLIILAAIITDSILIFDESRTIYYDHYGT